MNELKKRIVGRYADILRLLFAAAVLFYAGTLLKPARIIAALHEKFTAADNGAGIGGMSYTELQLNEINFEAKAGNGEVIIPEPEEYSNPLPLLYSIHQIQKGDMIGHLAENFGLNQGTLVSFNVIKNTRAIYPNEILKIPNQDGIMHSVVAGETLASIAEKYQVQMENIETANELFAAKINPGSKLFIPGAELDYAQLQEINGDVFLWPIYGRITSRYGYRTDPISGGRGFHNGVDLSAVTGTPIKAAMAGRVVTAGYSDVFGNYVVIAHQSNYRTLYGHMNSIRAKGGTYVKSGETIGYVGNTGLSTGSHLHFTVYKNGIAVNPLMLMH